MPGGDDCRVVPAREVMMWQCRSQSDHGFFWLFQCSYALLIVRHIHIECVHGYRSLDNLLHGGK